MFHVCCSYRTYNCCCHSSSGISSSLESPARGTYGCVRNKLRKYQRRDRLTLLFAICFQQCTTLFSLTRFYDFMHYFTICSQGFISSGYSRHHPSGTKIVWGNLKSGERVNATMKHFKPLYTQTQSAIIKSITTIYMERHYYHGSFPQNNFTLVL